jgi:hypothetical protein
MTTSPNHQCMIYTGSPSRHLPGLAILVNAQLRANWRCLYLNSPVIVSEMESHLYQVGVDVALEVERGALVLSSDQGHLLAGRFDVDRMLTTLAEAVNQALRDGYAGLWASGDLSWEFGGEKDFSKLLKYEFALERLFEQQPAFSGICQYHEDVLPTDVVQWGLCTHRSVYVNETLSRPNPYYAPASLLTYRRPVAPINRLREMFASPLHPLTLLSPDSPADLAKT